LRDVKRLTGLYSFLRAKGVARARARFHISSQSRACPGLDKGSSFD